jgi:hypothetical protein
MSSRPRTMIESPLRGDYVRNRRYARACMRDSLKRGEAPFAMHLLYAQVGILDDTVPEECALGIESGLAWLNAAEQVAFYIDLGFTEGMKKASDRADELGIMRVNRKLEGWSE